jgi:hypothetical protein
MVAKLSKTTFVKMGNLYDGAQELATSSVQVLFLGLRNTYTRKVFIVHGHDHLRTAFERVIGAGDPMMM